MNRDWIYASNPFEVMTAHSCRKMNRISRYTIDAINARIPVYNATSGGAPIATELTRLKNMLEPLANGFSQKYSSWINNKGGKKGNVSELAGKLALLRGVKIKQWDALIQTKYDQGSPAYLNLLPNRRVPFQKGKQEAMITAVSCLKDKVAADANLPAELKADVQAFSTALDNCYKASNGQKSKTSSAADDVEQARKALCTGLYRALGSIMSLFAGDPKQVESFFDLQLLRHHEQTIFRHHIKAGATKKIVQRSFEPEDEIRLVNKGKDALTFYLATSEKAKPGEQHVIIGAGEDKTVTAAALGAINGPYLMAANNSKLEGKYMVVLI